MDPSQQPPKENNPSGGIPPVRTTDGISRPGVHPMYGRQADHPYMHAPLTPTPQPQATAAPVVAGNDMRRPVAPPSVHTREPASPLPASGNPLAYTQPSPAQTQSEMPQKPRKKHWLLWSMLTLLVLALGAAAAGFAWYTSNLSAPQTEDASVSRITIEEGSTVNSIAQLLETEGLIKNALAFEIYYRLNAGDPLLAGEYTLARNLDVAGVIAELAQGTNHEYSLTFLPGESLADIKTTLEDVGFESATIDAAFAQQYPDFAMMSQRPGGSDVEGFVFPDTYNFGEDFTVVNILTRPFEHMQAYIDEENLEAAFAAQGLTLYEGIILASIIQKEVNNQSDMAHVSQVFHSRLKEGIKLGSDPTFVYGARKLGVQPLPSLESPYNTYLIDGLPPGPIANPGKEALYAAAYPSTDTNDLFFVAGDDGQTHFSRTNEEHEALTRQYCQERFRLDIF